jgi:hypothetical protein
MAYLQPTLYLLVLCLLNLCILRFSALLALAVNKPARYRCSDTEHQVPDHLFNSRACNTSDVPHFEQTGM